MPFDLFQPVETTRLRPRCVTPQDAEATSALMTQAVSDRLASWALPLIPTASSVDLPKKARLGSAQTRKGSEDPLIPLI